MRRHHLHGRLVALLAASVLLLAACPDDDTTVTVTPPGDAPDAGEPPEADDAQAERAIERHIFDLVNDERAERGLEPLEWSDQLAEGARSWSAEMHERGTFEHADAGDILDRVDGLVAVGENIFEATGPAPAGRVHVGWMESDGHRRNVLEPGFDRLGVGVVCVDGGAMFATQRFGSTGAGPDPDPDAAPPQDPIVGDADGGPSCPTG